MRAWLLLGTMACAAQAQTPPPATPAAAPCAAPEHRQFDFWLGEWSVSKPDGAPAGHSRIESILDGCVVMEHWRSTMSAFTGKSFNLYNRRTGRWEQFWVDHTGARLHLVGGLVDGAMVLSGVQDAPNAQTGLAQHERITWTPQPDGGVRQLWETSTDGGKTWSTSFDGRYRRVATGD